MYTANCDYYSTKITTRTNKNDFLLEVFDLINDTMPEISFMYYICSTFFPFVCSHCLLLTHTNSQFNNWINGIRFRLFFMPLRIFRFNPLPNPTALERILLWNIFHMTIIILIDFGANIYDMFFSFVYCVRARTFQLTAKCEFRMVSFNQIETFNLIWYEISIKLFIIMIIHSLFSFCIQTAFVWQCRRQTSFIRKMVENIDFFPHCIVCAHTGYLRTNWNLCHTFYLKKAIVYLPSIFYRFFFHISYLEIDVCNNER